MTPDAKLRVDVYQEGQRAFSSGAICPYIDWRAKTWAKGHAAAKEWYSFNGQSESLEAMAQQEQGEPVGEAFLCDDCQTPFDGAFQCPACGCGRATKEPVYTTPQQRKPLTDEQIEKLLDAVIADKKTKDQIGDFARAIETAHGIKE